jgi:hypothetical protein
MDRIKKHGVLKLYFNMNWAFFIFLFATTSYAQQNEVRKDSLQLNDSISGLAEYAYYTSKGKVVFDGNFDFQSVIESPLEDFDYQAITYQGSYSSDIKTGNWIFSEKKIKEVNKKFVSDFRIGNLADGTANSVSGTFQDGKAAGNWKVLIQDYLDSEIVDTLFSVESTFKNNRLVGAFNSASPSIEVQGYLNADGFFHGSWEILHKNEAVKEVRTYEAGVLKTYEFVSDAQTFEISYSGLDTSNSESDEEWIDYSIKEDYFEILNLSRLNVKQSVSASVEETITRYHQKSNDFITKSILSLSFHSGFDIWNNLKGSSPLELGKFKVRRYVLSAQEKQNTVELESNLKEIKTLLKRYTDNTQLKIGKPLYEKLDEIDLLLNVYKNELPKLERFVGQVSSKAFEFVDREHILPEICPQLKFPVEVTYEFQSKLITKSHEFPKVPDCENFDLESARDLTKAILVDVKDIDAKASKLLATMEAERSLSEDEEKLIARKSQIDDLFEGKSKESYNELHDRFSEQIINLAEKNFNAYANSTLNEKKNQIKDLLSCFDALTDFYVFLEDLEFKNNRLEDAYTRTTFNPYMMVDMSERIKENIYDAFSDHLRPYLMNRLKNDLTCQNLKIAMKDINSVYSKMIELSKRDTREEEKALKREKDPEAILSVLELKLNF